MIKKLIPFILLVIIAIPVDGADFQDNAEIIQGILNDGSPAPVEERSEPTETAKTQKEKKKKTAGSTARSAPGAEEEALRTAIDMYNNGFLDDSLRLFAEFRAKYPTSAYADTVRIWNGRVYMRKLDYNSAMAEFAAVPEDSGEYPSSLYEMSGCYITRGETVKAIEYLSRLSGRYPTNPMADDAILRIADLLARSGRGNEAVGQALRIIREYPDQDLVDDAYYFLGHLFETDPSIRDFDLARRFYKAFLKKAERNEPFFATSPLRSRVKEDLRILEKRQFRISD